MQRIVQVRNALVGAVNAQRILDQVVGADAQEIHLARQGRSGKRGRRHLDHDAHLDRIGKCQPALAQL